MAIVTYRAALYEDLLLPFRLREIDALVHPNLNAQQACSRRYRKSSHIQTRRQVTAIRRIRAEAFPEISNGRGVSLFRRKRICSSDQRHAERRSIRSLRSIDSRR